MGYEWDEKKCESNIEVHGVGFAAASDFEWNSARTLQDTRREYSETRFISYAPINGRLHVMVWTVREKNVRVISLRKANEREVARYDEG